jgi:aspartate racemase
MKTLGLLGGMSWESTVPYYRLINQAVQRRLGGLHSARLVMVSVDFHDIEVLQRAGNWTAAGEQLAAAARTLVQAGAQGVVLCTNTMHKVAPAIEAATPGVPLIHIADPTGQAVRAAGVSRVGLLGTRFTMEQDFYRDRLVNGYGLDVIVPPAPEREAVHRIIYDELCRGRIEPASRQRYREVMAGLVAGGAQAIILGCTEIGLLVDRSDASVPLLDTTVLHAEAAAQFSCAF